MPPAPGVFCRAYGKLPRVNARLLRSLAAFFFSTLVALADPPAPAAWLLRPAAVFDGQQLHPGWAVLVQGDKIAAAGPAAEVNAPDDGRTIDLPNDTLIPGLIEGHSHLFLHPYNETPWNLSLIHI